MSRLLDTILYGMATWRLARMMTVEEGPAGIFHTLQDYATGRQDWVGRGLGCSECLSIWLGVGFALVDTLEPEAARSLAIPFAISAVSVLLGDVELELGR